LIEGQRFLFQGLPPHPFSFLLDNKEQEVGCSNLKKIIGHQRSRNPNPKPRKRNKKKKTENQQTNKKEGRKEGKIQATKHLISLRGLQKPSFIGHIEFRDVSFTYPSRPDTNVLDHVNLSLTPGTVLALVGPSGGGKSTIVSLVERFYDPSSGSILIDGVDIRTLDPGWLRFANFLSIIPSFPLLFPLLFPF